MILRSVAEPTVSVVPEHFLSGEKRQVFSAEEGLAQNCCCGKHIHRITSTTVRNKSLRSVKKVDE
jgi:hypothetical protein